MSLSVTLISESGSQASWQECCPSRESSTPVGSASRPTPHWLGLFEDFRVCRVISSGCQWRIAIATYPKIIRVWDKLLTVTCAEFKLPVSTSPIPGPKIVKNYLKICHCDTVTVVGMSCPSWQWHRTGSRWSPVRTLPVAPLWCDLGFFSNNRGNEPELSRDERAWTAVTCGAACGESRPSLHWKGLLFIAR